MTHTYHVEYQLGSYFVEDEWNHVVWLYNGHSAQFASYELAQAVCNELNHTA